MNIASVASSFLQVSNEHTLTLTLEQSKVYQAPGFTTAERTAQRLFCARRCGWLPVCIDLTYESVRSRLAVSLLVLQLCLEFMLSVILPTLGFAGMSSCADAEALLGPALSPEAREAAESLNVSASALLGPFYAHYAYLILACLALSKWNSPIYCLVGTCMAVYQAITTTVVESGPCTRLLQMAPMRLPSGGSRSAYIANFTDTVALFNLSQLVCTWVIAATLIPLSLQLCLRRHRREILLCGTETQGASETEGGPAAGALAAAATGSSPAALLHRFLQLSRLVPLRHVVACTLTSFTLVLVSINVSSLLRIALEEYNELRAQVAGVSSSVDTVLGVVHDALAFMPLTVQLAAAFYIALQAYSFYPIARHTLALRQRYRCLLPLRQAHLAAAAGGAAQSAAGSAKTPLLSANYMPPQAGAAEEAPLAAAAAGAAAGAAPPPPAEEPGWNSMTDRYGLTVLGATPMEDAELTLAPDLRRFAFLGASSYIVTHTVLHLVVCLTLALLLMALWAALVLSCGGLSQSLLFLATAARTQLLGLLTSTLLPYLFLYVIGPGLALLGLQASKVCQPCRRAFVCAFSCCALADGPYVLAPQAWAAVDGVLSVTAGVVFGVLDAVTRLALALVWALVRTALLHEPVVPRVFASLDRGYNSYGGMMRAFLVRDMDLEESGASLPAQGHQLC